MQLHAATPGSRRKHPSTGRELAPALLPPAVARSVRDNEDARARGVQRGPGAVDKHGQSIPHNPKPEITSRRSTASPARPPRACPHSLYKLIEMIDGHEVVKYTDRNPVVTRRQVTSRSLQVSSQKFARRKIADDLRLATCALRLLARSPTTPLISTLVRSSRSYAGPSASVAINTSTERHAVQTRQRESDPRPRNR